MPKAENKAEKTADTETTETEKTEKNVPNPEEKVTEPARNPVEDLVDLFVDRDPSDDNPNLVIGFNGKNYVMPKGEVSRVPKYIKDEYERSKRAQYKADKTVAEMKGIRAAN